MTFTWQDRATVARLETKVDALAERFEISQLLARIESRLDELSVESSSPEEIAAVAKSVKEQTDQLAASRDEANKV